MTAAAPTDLHAGPAVATTAHKAWVRIVQH
jgi:hypothetical protein